MTVALVNYEFGGPGGEAQFADLRLAVVNLKLDTSYPTGGSVGVAARLGFRSLAVLIPLQHSGYIVEYINDTDKLKVYQQPAAATAGASPEVPNTTNLSGTVLRFLAMGV